jgi:hypothetical protein
MTSPENKSTSNTATPSEPPVFHVMLPKLIDPSLTPGWIFHCPLPLEPSSIAEQQKTATYLTAHWNMRVENKMLPWLKLFPGNTSTANPSIEKDIFYFDLAQSMLDMMIEFQLQNAGIAESGDSRLGKGYTPFDCVDVPCLLDSVLDEEIGEDFEEVNGRVVCKKPEKYIFWDAFNIGAVAKRLIGLEAAALVLAGRSVRVTIEKSYGDDADADDG